MEWKIVVSIILLPLTAIVLWYVFNLIQPNKIIVSEPVTFVHTGNLIKDNPGLKPDVWYLSYESSDAGVQSAELQFDGTSRCGSEGMLKVCDISFEQGQRVRVEGQTPAVSPSMIRPKNKTHKAPPIPNMT